MGGSGIGKDCRTRGREENYSPPVGGAGGKDVRRKFTEGNKDRSELSRRGM